MRNRAKQAQFILLTQSKGIARYWQDQKNDEYNLPSCQHWLHRSLTRMYEITVASTRLRSNQSRRFTRAQPSEGVGKAYTETN